MIRLNKIKHPARGFTLIELIAVLIIVGILAKFVAPKFLSSSMFQAQGTADQIKSALRFGQKNAIAQRHQMQVSVTKNSSTSSACTLKVVSYVVSCATPSNVTLTAKTFYFDALGRPVTAAGVANSAQDSLVVGDATSGTTTILIEQETGYVH